MQIPGKRVPRTRWIHTDRYVVAVDVELVIPDADPSEPCYEPHTIEHLRDVEAHARRGDVDWLMRHGRVYQAVSGAMSLPASGGTGS